MITREIISNFKEKVEELNKIKGLRDEAQKTAQDRYAKTVVHKLTRNGKEVEILEKVLWEEVFYLGIDSEAGEILKKQYPEVFELHEKEVKLAEELKIISVRDLNIDFTRMMLSDYINLIEQMFHLLTEEKEKNKE